MTEIGFYHLTRSGADEALAQLLGRTLQGGQRALVRCRDAERVEAVDSGLWRVAEPIWLPHGTTRIGDAALQPIWITADVPGDVGSEDSATHDAPNGAAYLFLLDGVRAPDAAKFERIFDLFDGNDAQAVTDARLRWTRAKADGHTLAYWKQEPKGWVRAG